jgi:hypothetical protein
MTTEPEREFAALEAQLAQLPQWQPRADFTARLAAAAARQQARPEIRPPSTQQWLRGELLRHLPLTVGAGLTALVLAILPWSAVAGSPALPWIVAGGAAVFGVVVTLRLLRSP